MNYEFTIPLTKDDLLCPSEGSYVVQEVYSVRGLPGRVGDAVNVLNSGPYNILQVFDVFFSVAKHFAGLDNKIKFECWKCLNKALDKQMSDLINVLEQNNIDRDTRKEHRNTLKMFSYLLTQFAEEFEAEECKPSVVAAPGRKRAKSKKSASALPFDWSEVKKDFLNITTQLLQINIVSLWEPPVAEEEFVNTFANCCYKFLENPGINRDKILRDSILNVLAILVKKYNQSLSVGVKVIQLLQHFEHMITPMAQLVQVCAVEHGMRNIVVDILREIGRIDPKDLERDASGTRCYSDFLVELASRIPEHVLPNISLLLCHLDAEPYSMRNGVLGVMGKLVVLRLSEDDLTENMKDTRDQILDHLENHIHDVHAYVRSKVLQIWQNICREKAIPLARQQHVLGLVISRLTDISSNVRKNAIIFLKEYLMSNAFGSKFPLAEVKKRLLEEKEKLKKMDPNALVEDDEAAEAVNPADLKRWLELECDIKRVVEDHWDVEDIVDEDGEHVEFQGDVNEAREYAMMNVKRQLVSGDYVKALAVLKAAVVTWPEYEMLKINEEKVKSTEESDENRNDEETNKNKEDIVSREVKLFKKIFLNPEFGPAVSNPEQGNEEEQQEGNINANADSLVNEVSKQQIVIQYLKDYLSFHTQYQHAVMVVCRLLGSQVNSDVHESIEFVVIAYEFGLNNALLGVRRMLSLVWSKDNDIKNKVVDAYTRLYLNPQVQGARAKAEAIVKNLFALLDGASIGDLTSLDELVYKLMKTNLIPKNVIHLLWEKFSMKDPLVTQEESRSAIKLLGMLARGKHEIVKSNIEVLVNIGFGERAKNDALLVRDTCTILLTLNKTEEMVHDDKQGPLRFSSDHIMFRRLHDILLNSITSPIQGMWVPMAEEAINVIYNLGEHPEKICDHLIKSLITKIFGREEKLDGYDTSVDKANVESPSSMSCPSYVLARFLAAAGHIALQQVVHLEVNVLSEIKRRERLKEDRKGERKSTTSTSVSQTPKTKEGASETLEDEMGLTGATAEDAEAEYIKKICDHEIVTGGNNLLSLLGSIIVNVCNNPVKYCDLQLQTAASLALSKFMLVSAEFCDKNLQLLFTILEKSRHEVIRSNTIISLGDLTPRFPNLIEPWTPNLYARLRDDSSQVRMNTMKIMTRLILNDMVKVKGQISEMATCLEDDDSRIAELAKSFFSELAKKGNAVYNILPDVISRLSDPETGIQEAPFRNIMSYLFSFIQKDRQCESLVEKLCHRFRATRTDRQWVDLSFCLAQLSYNERSLRKLQENFACFQSTLSNDEVFGFFNTIIGKCKKMAKPEIKVVVEELELRITTCHEKGVEDEAGYERANQASAAARVLVGKSVNTPANKKTRSTKGHTPASRRRRKNDSESEVVPKPRSTRKSARKSKKTVIEFDSDEDEMMEKEWDEIFEAEKENVEV